MASFKKLMEEMLGMAVERIENNPNDFRYVEESEEDTRRKIKYLDLHLKDAIDFEEKREELEANGSLGLAYHKLGDYETAEKYYKRQLELATSQTDETSMRRAHCNLGVINKVKWNLKGAVYHYNMALEIANKKGENYAKAKLMNNLANIMELVMDFDKAIEYQQERLKLSQKLGDRDGMCKAYSALGSLYHCKGDLETSINHYENLLTQLRTKLKIQDNLADDASGSSDDDYVDFDAPEGEEEDEEEKEVKKEEKKKKSKLPWKKDGKGKKKK